MKNFFNLLVFPAVLSVCFATFADDRGGDRVNNGFVDNTLEKNNLGEGKVKGKDPKACAKDDKECLKKEADAKKKAEAKTEKKE